MLTDHSVQKRLGLESKILWLSITFSPL